MADTCEDVPDGEVCDTCGHEAIGRCGGCGAPLGVDCLYEDSQCRWYESIGRPDCSAAFTPYCEAGMDGEWMDSEWPSI